MKRKKHTGGLILCLIMALGPSCEVEGPAGMDGPWVKGTLEGTIDVYDEFGRSTEDRSGFMVSVEPSSLNATTDYEGHFHIDSVPTGTYNLICSKKGYMDARSVGYQFVGGGTMAYNSFNMVLPSTTRIESIQFEKDDYNEIIMSGFMSPKPTSEERRELVLFFHSNNNVSHTGYLYCTFVRPYYNDVDDNGFFSLRLYDSPLLEEMRYDNFSTYYIKAYGITPYDLGFPDLETGLWIYPSLNMDGASNVAILELY